MRIRGKSLYTKMNTHKLHINLQNFWEDSAIQNINLDLNCVKAINDFVTPSIEKKIIPEVGGYLLGSFEEIEKGIYNITIEYFFPDKKAEVSPHKIVFSDDAILELDDLKDKLDLITIGWFHTHPSYTPCLSKTDIRLHEGAFIHKYQVAIVLDPLTEHWDTGFFTRKIDNTLNNKGVHKKWFHWNKIISQ